MLVAFAIAVAQTPTQGDQKQKSDACCSMETCCCNSGSCPLKQEGATAAEAKDAGCCCNGDSCEMKDGENARNHANHPCCNDSCDMKKHDGKQHDGKSDCCNIKNKAKSKAKQKAA
jgi:hypothetical protein